MLSGGWLGCRRRGRRGRRSRRRPRGSRPVGRRAHRGGDLLHLGHPAPALGGGRRSGALRPLGQGRLGQRPLGQQRPLHAPGPGQGSGGQQQRRAALGPRGVRHLHRRRRVERAVGDPRVKRRPAEQDPDLVGARAGQVEPRVAGDLGRQADDPAVDVGRARRRHDGGDLLGGGDRDRVRVDVDPGVPGRGDLRGDVEGGVRRADREDHRGPLDQPVERHPGQLARQRAPGGRPRPAGRVPEHLMPDRDQAAADGGPHLPRVQQPNGRHRNLQRGQRRSVPIVAVEPVPQPPRVRTSTQPECGRPPGAATRRCPAGG